MQEGKKKKKAGEKMSELEILLLDSDSTEFSKRMRYSLLRNFPHLLDYDLLKSHRHWKRAVVLGI